MSVDCDSCFRLKKASPGRACETPYKHSPEPDHMITDLANLIHVVEKNEWPKVSAHPAGNCLGGDRCTFVATAVWNYLNGQREAPQCLCLRNSGVPDLDCTVHGIGPEEERIAGDVRKVLSEEPQPPILAPGQVLRGDEAAEYGKQVIDWASQREEDK